MLKYVCGNASLMCAPFKDEGMALLRAISSHARHQPCQAGHRCRLWHAPASRLLHEGTLIARV